MFNGVYHIPRLTANIVSVGQLDEVGYDIRIKDGVMKIHEPSGRLLVRIERAHSQCGAAGVPGGAWGGERLPLTC
jgi:hypothetical protein